MRIEIGKYVITSDSHNIILNEKKVRKEGDNVGQEYLDQVGYYSTLEECVQGIVELKVRGSEATTLKELVKEVAEVKKMIKTALKGL